MRRYEQIRIDFKMRSQLDKTRKLTSKNEICSIII